MIDQSAELMFRIAQMQRELAELQRLASLPVAVSGDISVGNVTATGVDINAARNDATRLLPTASATRPFHEVYGGPGAGRASHWGYADETTGAVRLGADKGDLELLSLGGRITLDGLPAMLSRAHGMVVDVGEANINTDASGDQTVNFTQAFGGTPIVMVQIRVGTTGQVSNHLSGLPSASAFTYRLTRNDAVWQVSAGQVSWIAIGPR